MEKSYGRRNQVAWWAQCMEFGQSSTWMYTCQREMDLCCQKQWSKESPLCCKRIHIDLWNRFWRNFLTSCKIWNYSPPPIYRSAGRLGHWSAWCQNGISLWRTQWGDLYGTAQRFCQRGSREEVCCLLKAIYGLKQAALQWNKALHQSLLKMGFTRTYTNPGVYIHFNGQDLIILVIYIDDALFMGSNRSYWRLKKAEFMKKWESWDLGEAKEYLGLRITRDQVKETLKLDQITYTDKVVKHFKLDNAKIAHTPLPSGYNPLPNPTPSTSNLHSHYQSVIGSLLWIMLGTHPDITQAVIKMSQFSSNPSEDHLQKALYIMRYLLGTRPLCIKYDGASTTGFVAYSDTDWAGDHETHRSTSGYAIFLGEGIVSWLSRWQWEIPSSSTEAEYVGMTEVAKQLSWIRNLLSKLKFQLCPIPLLVDNQGAIFLASNPAQEGHTKHIEIPEHFIHECIHDGKIKLYYVPTTEQVADTFTKNLTWQHFEENHRKLWMIPYSLTTWTVRWSVEVQIFCYWLCSLFMCQLHSQSWSQSHHQSDVSHTSWHSSVALLLYLVLYITILNLWCHTSSDLQWHYIASLSHHINAIAHHSCSWLIHTFFMDRLHPLWHLSHYKNKQSFTYKYPEFTPQNIKFSCTPKHDNFQQDFLASTLNSKWVASHSLGFSHFTVASAAIGK